MFPSWRSRALALSRPSCAYTHLRRYHELSFSPEKDRKKSVEDRLQYHQRSLEQEAGSIRVLAAPWNPADHMTVMGTYPSLGSSDDSNRGLLCNARVAGHEGWGRRTCDGTFVVPGRSGLGTFRSHMTTTHQSSDWIPLQRGAELYDKCGPHGPAALFQTAGTAACMLTSLQPGDCVIQNAGNSAVGLMVSQWAFLKCQARPISLVRRGERTDAQVDEMVSFLKEFGKNEHVFVEDEEVQKVGIPSLLQQKGLPRPKLGINAVGGESSTHLIKALADKGLLITYGGMSQRPVPMSAYHLIFRNVSCVGYWHSRWMARDSTLEERETLMNSIVDAVLDHGLQVPPHQCFPLADYRKALQWDQSNTAIRKKIMFDCQESP